MSYAINSGYNSSVRDASNLMNFRNNFPNANTSFLRLPHPSQIQYPQQNFGIGSMQNYYAPPPMVSYGAQFTPFNAGHMGNNQSIGVLASAVSGIAMSTPSWGGYTPGSLSSYGNPVAYKQLPPFGNAWHQQPYMPSINIAHSSPQVQNYKSMSMGW